MDQDQKQLCDHDAIITLIEAFKNLKDSQEKFHTEMKDTMLDLRNNYSSTLKDHETRLRKTETNITRILTYGTAFVVFVGILEFIINTYVQIK